MGKMARLYRKAKGDAEMSSIYYNFIESTKMSHRDIHSYLKYILTEIQIDPESVDYKSSLPYSPKLSDSIKVK